MPEGVIVGPGTNMLTDIRLLRIEPLLALTLAQEVGPR
jgi:hypothetical protein